VEPLTIFDAINDKTLWSTEYCGWCDQRLPGKDQLTEDEIIIRAGVGQHGDLYLIGFHVKCYDQHRKNDLTLEEIFNAGE